MAATTSYVQISPALAAEVDILCGDGNLAAQRNFTGQRDTDFYTSLCTEVVEAALTVVNKLREVERRISYNLVSNIRAEEWMRLLKAIQRIMATVWRCIILGTPARARSCKPTGAGNLTKKTTPR